MDKFTRESEKINAYKRDYRLFSKHEGKREFVLIELKNLIESYLPYIKKVTLKDYQVPVDKELRVQTKLVENFLHKNFPEKVYKDFVALPRYDLAERVGNLTGVMLDAHFDTRGTLIQRNKDRTIQQEKFLSHIYRCLEDYGLHSFIQNRPIGLYDSYWVEVSHKFERKNTKKAFIGNLSRARFVDEYVTPFLEKSGDCS